MSGRSLKCSVSFLKGIKLTYRATFSIALASKSIYGGYSGVKNLGRNILSPLRFSAQNLIFLFLKSESF